MIEDSPTDSLNPEPAPIPPDAAAQIADTRTPEERRLANLKPPWPKGTSGNPKGTLKGFRAFTDALRRFMDIEVTGENPLTGEKGVKMRVSERIALRLIVKAANGDRLAIQDIADRLEGKSLTRLGGPNGEPLPTPASTTDISDALAKLTDDELRALANRGRRPA